LGGKTNSKKSKTMTIKDPIEQEPNLYGCFGVSVMQGFKNIYNTKQKLICH